MDIQNFFIEPTSSAQKQYEALRAFFLDKKPAADVAAQFGYTLTALYSLTRDFRKQRNNDNAQQRFFVVQKPGRKPAEHSDEMRQSLLSLNTW